MRTAFAEDLPVSPFGEFLEQYVNIDPVLPADDQIRALLKLPTSFQG